MTKNMFLILLILISQSGYAKTDTLAFYAYSLAVNSAEDYIIDGNYDSAILSYQIAFSKHLPLALDIYNAIVTASISKDQAFAEKCAWLLAEKGVGSHFFKKNSILKSYRTNPNWENWLKKADSEKRKRETFNQELISRITWISFTANNLYRIWTQSIIGTISQETELEKQMNQQNSFLIDSLYNLVDQFGYPSEEKIGVNILGDTAISYEPIFSRIILSGYSRPNGIGGGTFDQLLNASLDSGFIKPFFFAKMHDFKNYQNDYPYGTTFFSGLNGMLYHSIHIDIKKIEQDRKEIGLSSLKHYAKLIEFIKQKKLLMFRFGFSFTEQDRFLNNEAEKLEFTKNHVLYEQSNFE